MFEAIIPAIYSQTSAKGTVFECKMTDVVSETVIGDSLRINQILLNLLSNAIKFTPAGGTICLTARQTPVKNRRTKLILIVEDTGIGMSEEFLHRLFTPFEQEDGTLSRKHSGTGLGMAITENIVRMMNGTITVESELGKGSKFTVSIPLEVYMGEEAGNTEPVELSVLSVSERDKKEPVKRAENSKLCGGRILLAEDNEINREIAVELLEMQGMEVTAVEDGKKAKGSL